MDRVIIPPEPDNPPEPAYTLTYIKFDSAPISVDDYDYRTSYATGGGMLFAKNSNIPLARPVSFSNKTLVYVWGRDARYNSGVEEEFHGQIEINGTLMYGGYSYSTAECFQLSDNVELKLGFGMGYDPSSGN